MDLLNEEELKALDEDDVIDLANKYETMPMLISAKTEVGLQNVLHSIEIKLFNCLDDDSVIKTKDHAKDKIEDDTELNKKSKKKANADAFKLIALLLFKKINLKKLIW